MSERVTRGGEEGMLDWLHRRLVEVHGENPDFGYMQELKALAISQYTHTPKVSEQGAPLAQYHALIGRIGDAMEEYGVAEIALGDTRVLHTPASQPTEGENHERTGR